MNLTAATAIGIWGLATWDYGSAGFHGSNEGWFEQDLKHGGPINWGIFGQHTHFLMLLPGCIKIGVMIPERLIPMPTYQLDGSGLYGTWRCHK